MQGFPKQEHYVKYNGPFFGETIGRVANRIAAGKIDSLNGQTYTLAKNNGENALHGGEVGWGKRVWEGPVPVGVRRIPGVQHLEGGEFRSIYLLVWRYSGFRTYDRLDSVNWSEMEY